MKRPTITDVAKAAGVSVATVDRVLNGRLPVREETSRRVFEAAEKIGLTYAQVYSCRLNFTFKHVISELEKSGWRSPWAKG